MKSDEEIAVLVQKGDKEKFGLLMERYQAKLSRYGRRFLSSKENIEDIVQDIFIKTYENLQSFDSSQKFSPWIYRIAHNTFINELKRNSRAPINIFDLDTLVPHPEYQNPLPEEKRQEEIKKAIEEGLDQLTPNYKEILILYYLEGLSYIEIADILRIPVGTVGIRLKRGREMLKANLGEEILEQNE